MAAKATLDSIMRQASDNYLNLIPNDSHRPKLKAEIQSATVEDLLKQVHDLEDKFSKNSRFRRLSKRLSPCVEQLQRFTAVVTICIQSDPQLSSLIWGGLKFLLQLASEFQEFFEKLIRTIEQMTKVIPDYQIYLDRFSTDDSLCQHLVSIYVDIIGFWRQATQIFLKPSQDPRSNVSVICSIAWRPFDSRFKEIVTRFSENCTYLERRVKALSCREEMIQAREAAEQAKTEDEARKQQSIAAQKEKLAVNYERIAANHERTESSLFRERYSEFESELRGTIKAQIQNDKDHRFLEIRTWLNPASCVDKKAEISNDRHPGSGEFVLRSSQYRQWLDRGISEPKNEPFKRGLLWINGKPGSGKTYLSALLIEDLLSISAQNTAYFYCDWKDSDRSTTRGLLSTLLFQFLANNKELPQLIDAFILAMMDSASAVANSVEELWQLLSIILKLCPGSIIVVDGLDELEDNYNGIVAAQRFSTLSLLNQSARILILGRDSSLPLEKNLSKHICLSLHTDAIQDDICKYIASRAGELVSLGFSNTTATRILHHLSSLATGMFLWARLALDVLSSPALSPSQRTEVFETIILVEGLEDFYSRIVERILRQPRPERELSSKIIMWILNGRRFQMEELNVAIAQGNQPLKTHETVKSLQDIAHIACGGLVRIDGKCIEFIHLSFHEYLRKRVSQSRSATTIHGELPMFQPMHIQQAMVATTCLNYLLQTVPARPLAGDIHKKSSYGELYSKYPFLMYASRFWVRHAKEAMINGTTTLAEPVTLELVSKMEILFASREHQLVWIEAMLPYGLEILMLEFVSIRAWLLSFPQYESLSARIGAFERDARMFYLNFVFDFQNREERDVWTGMSDFLSPDSPLNQNPANATECKPSPPFLTDNETLTMIRMTSETSADGTTLFLATVWACSVSGTVVTVDKWDIATSSKQDMCFPIKILLESNQCHPVAFSPDLSILVVANQVYRVSSMNALAPSRMFGKLASWVWGILAPPSTTIQLPESCQGLLEYSLIISPTNEHMCYYTLGSDQEDIVILIYSLKDFCRTSLVHETRLGWDPKKSAKFIFHPSESILAWSTEVGTGAFRPPLRVPPKNYNSSLSQYLISPEYIQDLQFSESGQYLQGSLLSDEGVPISLGLPKSLLENWIMTEAEKESRPRNVDLAKYQKVSDDASPAIFRHSAEILRIKNRWSAGDGTSYSVQICHPFERAVLYRLTPSGTLEHRTLARFPQNRQWDCKRTKIVWSAAPPSAPSGSTALVLPTGFPDGSVREIRALTFTMNCDDLVRNGSPHGYPLIYTKQVADIEPWGPQAPPDVPRRLADAQENCTCTKLLGKRMVRARLEMMIYSNSYFLDHLERDWLINLWRCAENLDPDFHLHIEGPLGGLRLRRFTDDDDDDDNSYSVLAHEVAREVMAMTVRRKYYPEPRRTVGDL